MGLYQAITEIEYPESDGQPMGETDVHRRWMMRIQQLLEQRYQGQQVYVACDLLLYYVEGSPHKYVVPDNFVVKNINPGDRRTYKVWEEGQAPQVVFEVTSRGTRREDEVHKPEIYSRIGVRELFLYDPTSEYLRPPLQGYALGADEPVRIEPDLDGRIASSELGITLHLDGRILVMTDTATGKTLLTEAETERLEKEIQQATAETERAAKEAERAAKEVERVEKEAERAAKEAERVEKEAERTAREAAEAAAAALQKENAQLRQQLEQRNRNGE